MIVLKKAIIENQEERDYIRPVPTDFGQLGNGV